MTRPVYLDYNATTPVAPEVAEAIRPFLYESFRQPIVLAPACVWATCKGPCYKQGGKSPH